MKHERNIYLSNMALQEAISIYTSACNKGELSLGSEYVPTVDL